MELWFLPLAFCIGGMIGAVGIGGVVLAPAINVLLGVPVHSAVPSAMACFLFSGTVGTLAYQLRQSIRWSMLPALLLAVGASAFAGSFAIAWIPEAVLRTGLALFVILAGLQEFTGLFGAAAGSAGAELSQGRLLAIGAATGAGSALTATGGPLILVPTLLLLSVPVQVAVGLGQVSQIPISLMATSAHYLNGGLDLQRVLPIALAVGLGTGAGAFAGRLLPVALLRRTIAAILIAFGLVYMLAG